MKKLEYNIEQKQDILKLIENIVQKTKEYELIIENFGLNMDYNLEKILDNYVEKNWKVVFDNDSATQLEYQSVLNPDEFIENYKVKLRKNEKITKVFIEMEETYRKLGIEITDEYADINFFSNDEFRNFCSKRYPELLDEIKKYFGEAFVDNMTRVTEYPYQLLWNKNMNTPGPHFEQNAQPHRKHHSSLVKILFKSYTRNNGAWKKI